MVNILETSIMPDGQIETVYQLGDRWFRVSGNILSKLQKEERELLTNQSTDKE